MGNRYKENFWATTIITYAITLAFVVFTCLIQYNVSDPSAELMFYKIKFDSYIFLLFAKAVETLVPTTITFGFTLLLGTFGEAHISSLRYACSIALLVILSFSGMVLPIAKDVGNFEFIAIVITVLVTITLIAIRALVGSMSRTRKPKREKSDGQL